MEFRGKHIDFFDCAFVAVSALSLDFCLAARPGPAVARKHHADYHEGNTKVQKHMMDQTKSERKVVPVLSRSVTFVTGNNR